MANSAGMTVEKCVSRYNWIKDMLCGGIGLNCTEIADRLGVTIKTAQRYIVRLRRDGYMVEYIALGRKYRITNPAQLTATDVLRQAYGWAVKHGVDAEWVGQAANFLKANGPLP